VLVPSVPCVAPQYKPANKTFEQDGRLRFADVELNVESVVAANPILNEISELVALSW
jgi:hypothetical protein